MKPYINPDGSFGRYRISTPEEMEILIEQYFQKCDGYKEERLLGTGANAIVAEVPVKQPYSWIELALEVGLSGTQSLDRYFDYEGYGPVLQRAVAKINAQWEKCLQRPANNSGVIYALDNNSRYKNRKEINLGGQPDNPIRSVSDLSDEALEAVLEIIEADEIVNGDE